MMKLIRKLLGLNELEENVKTLTNHISDISQIVDGIKHDLDHWVKPLLWVILSGFIAGIIYMVVD